MAGPYREKIFGVLVKVETTSGTDAVPTGSADAVKLVGIPTLTYGYLEQGNRDDVQSGRLIREDRTEAAGRFGRIEVTLEVKGSGAAGTAPEADALLRISGRSKSVSAGVSVTYTTLDEGMETGTVYCYSAGKLFKLVGCIASMKLSAEAAKRGLMTFSIVGKMSSDPTEVSLPALTLSSILPPLFHTSVASIGSWASNAGSDPLVVKSAELDDAAITTERPSAGAADGLVGYLITDRAMKQTMNVEVPALATFDAYALSKAVGSSQPLSVWQIGVSAGNRLIIQTGRWSQEAPKMGAVGGINTMSLEGTLGAGAPTSGRDLNLVYS
jgi:hypothetical protein